MTIRNTKLGHCYLTMGMEEIKHAIKEYVMKYKNISEEEYKEVSIGGFEEEEEFFIELFFKNKTL